MSRPVHPLSTRLARLLSLAGLLLGTAAPAVDSQPHRPAPPPEAQTLVRQMLAAYRQAASIQESSTATFTPLQGDTLTQSYTLKYQRPNRLAIVAQDRENGLLAAYADGSLVRFYSESRKAYRENPAPPDLAATVDRIGALAKQLTGSGFDQTLNPISFLLAQGMPREGSRFRYRGIEKVTGHRAYVVTGPADETWAGTLLHRSDTQPRLEQRDITLYIDAESHLLLRARARLRWSITTPAVGKKQPAYTRSYGFTFDETHFGTTLNKPLRPEEFTFTPPKDVHKE